MVCYRFAIRYKQLIADVPSNWRGCSPDELQTPVVTDCRFSLVNYRSYSGLALSRSRIRSLHEPSDSPRERDDAAPSTPSENQARVRSLAESRE